MTQPPHPIRLALDRAIGAMMALRAPDIPDAPTHADASAFNEALMAWAEISDAVTLAFGDYAQTVFGLNKREIDDGFRDQLTRALDGNATHYVEGRSEWTTR